MLAGLDKQSLPSGTFVQDIHEEGQVTRENKLWIFPGSEEDENVRSREIEKKEKKRRKKEKKKRLEREENEERAKSDTRADVPQHRSLEILENSPEYDVENGEQGVKVSFGDIVALAYAAKEPATMVNKDSV